MIFIHCIALPSQHLLLSFRCFRKCAACPEHANGTLDVNLDVVVPDGVEAIPQLFAERFESRASYPLHVIAGSCVVTAIPNHLGARSADAGVSV